MKTTEKNYETTRERTFPLRLNKQESDALSELRQALQVTTDVAAVRHVITHYLQQNAALTAQQLENRQLKQQISELKQRISNFTGALRQLSFE
jgi:regulator of replication initiation timing